MTVRRHIAMVTGAGGFIGVNLCRALVSAGFETHAIVRPGRGDAQRPLPTDATVHELDLQQSAAVQAVLAAVRPSLLFNAAVHNAHLPDQRLSEIVRGNTLIVANLLDACAEVGFPRLVQLGSSLEYGLSRTAHRESDPLDPVTPRGVTKAAATQLALVTARRDSRPIAVIRPFSVYGPWQHPARLVPRAIRAGLTGEELPLTGPHLRRDFVFVEDVVDACLRAAHHEAARGKVINVGTGVETANEELVAEIERLLGQKIRVEIGAQSERETDRPHWRADIAMAKQLLDWEPRHTLAAGLERTAAWVENLLEQGKL